MTMPETRRGQPERRSGRRHGRAEERRLVRVLLRHHGGRDQDSDGCSLSSSCVVHLWICHHSAHHHREGCNIAINEAAGGCQTIFCSSFSCIPSGGDAVICMSNYFLCIGQITTSR